MVLHLSDYSTCVLCSASSLVSESVYLVTVCKYCVAYLFILTRVTVFNVDLPFCLSLRAEVHPVYVDTLCSCPIHHVCIVFIFYAHIIASRESSVFVASSKWWIHLAVWPLNIINMNCVCVWCECVWVMYGCI